MGAVLQLTIGQWRGGIDVGQCTGSQCGSFGGTSHKLCVGVVGSLEAVPVSHLLGGLHHLVGYEGGTLLVGAAGNGQVTIRLRVVGTLVGHDGYGTVLTQQQPVVVSTHETGLSLEVAALFLGHLIVAVDIMDEYGGLVDALVGINPGIAAYILVIVTQHQCVKAGQSVSI